MDFRADHFSLFGLNPGFRLDLSDLDSRYRDIQAQVHPDRFANAGDAERRLSMQWATHANEAYQHFPAFLFNFGDTAQNRLGGFGHIGIAFAHFILDSFAERLGEIRKI